jgi:hypothetical protein
VRAEPRAHELIERDRLARKLDGERRAELAPAADVGVEEVGVPFAWRLHTHCLASERRGLRLGFGDFQGQGRRELGPRRAGSWPRTADSRRLARGGATGSTRCSRGLPSVRWSSSTAVLRPAIVGAGELLEGSRRHRRRCGL